MAVAGAQEARGEREGQAVLRALAAAVVGEAQADLEAPEVGQLREAASLEGSAGGPKVPVWEELVEDEREEALVASDRASRGRVPPAEWV